MSPVEAIVLGIVQGLTEFLPISSTAHLIIVPALLGWPDAGTAYNAVIQLGSVVAVIAYFFRDLAKILIGSITALKEKNFANQDLRILGAILFGTLPICVVGLLLKPMLEQDNSPLRSFMVVGVASIFMGLLLLLAEKVATHRRGLDSIGARDGLLVGLGQTMALIPGCSRSGSTLTVAMLLNMKREEAARFSFLLGIPAIVLSGLLELKKLVHSGMDQSASTNLIIGLVVSLVVSYISIAWLLKYLQKHSTLVFVVYRIIFGSTAIFLASRSMSH